MYTSCHHVHLLSPCTPLVTTYTSCHHVHLLSPRTPLVTTYTSRHHVHLLSLCTTTLVTTYTSCHHVQLLLSPCTPLVTMYNNSCHHVHQQCPNIHLSLFILPCIAAEKDHEEHTYFNWPHLRIRNKVCLNCPCHMIITCSSACTYMTCSAIPLGRWRQDSLPQPTHQPLSSRR